MTTTAQKLEETRRAAFDLGQAAGIKKVRTLVESRAKYSNRQCLIDLLDAIDRMDGAV